MSQQFYGPTSEAEIKINNLLQLPATGKEQDWEIELSDPSKIGLMFDLLLNAGLSGDESDALICLIIASLEEMHASSTNISDYSYQLNEYFNKNSAVKKKIMCYWYNISDDHNFINEIF